MRTLYKKMKSKKTGISEEKLIVFESIINKYFTPGSGGSQEGDRKYMEAINEQFTKAERLKLWEKCGGGCVGSSVYEKARKGFAVEYAKKPIAARLDLYVNEFENRYGHTKSIEYDEKNNTIIHTFACKDCYKRSINGIAATPFEIYYESCAIGRLQNLQSALGIKLKIKNINIPSQGVSWETPCIYTFEIIQ